MTGVLRVLDLFSGIGGFSLGLERTGGFETVAFCERDPFCAGVLRRHWPEVKLYEDVWSARLGEEAVDLVTAGFPCQDISSAGKRAGITGGRSSAFWAVLRAIRLVGRPMLLLENVAAMLGRGMGDVCGALAEVGYDAEWHCIPASAVGAPHHRDRLWILANPQRNEGGEQEPCCGPFGRMGWVEQSVSWDGGWQAALTKFRGMDDGLPRRVDRTDALRNSLVPQIPEMIGRAILESSQNVRAA